MKGVFLTREFTLYFQDEKQLAQREVYPPPIPSPLQGYLAHKKMPTPLETP